MQRREVRKPLLCALCWSPLADLNTRRVDVLDPRSTGVILTWTGRALRGLFKLGGVAADPTHAEHGPARVRVRPCQPLNVGCLLGQAIYSVRSSP